MKTIIVLSDGETWDTTGYIVTITDAAYKWLQSGADPHDLSRDDHLMEVEIVPKDIPHTKS